MKKFLFLLLVLLQAGCANSQDYQRYLDSHAAIQTAKYQAEAEKYKAIATIAASSDQTAKVAAVMALSQSNSNSPVPVSQPLRADGRLLETCSQLSYLQLFKDIVSYRIRKDRTMYVIKNWKSS